MTGFARESHILCIAYDSSIVDEDRGGASAGDAKITHIVLKANDLLTGIREGKELCLIDAGCSRRLR